MKNNRREVRHKRAIRRHHYQRRLAMVLARPFATILDDRLNYMMANTTIWVRHKEPKKGKYACRRADYIADLRYREQLREVA